MGPEGRLNPQDQQMDQEDSPLNHPQGQQGQKEDQEGFPQ